MYYKNNDYASSVKRASYSINDFSSGVDFTSDKRIVPLYKAALSHNFKMESGALTDGFGIKNTDYSRCDLKLGTIVGKKLFYFKNYDSIGKKYVDNVLVYSENGDTYAVKPNLDKDFKKVDGLSFSKAPKAVRYTYNGKNVIIFSADGVMKVYDGESVTNVSDAPCITSMCIHNERLFATEDGEKSMVWFSDDFDPLNWKISLTDAGFIDLRDERGSLLKILSFNGYLYVFRNYGITRITAFGDQTQFAVDGVATSSGKIIGESITLCGDRIIYLAEDGFYSFNGGAPVKILDSIDECLSGVDNFEAKGEFYNGKFYCSLNLKIDNTVQKCVLCYDLHGKSFMICKNLNVTDFCAADGDKEFKLLFLCADNGAIGELSDKSELFSAPILKRWQSGFFDFGLDCEKVVSQITLYSKTKIRLTVKSETEQKTVNFLASKKPQTMPVGIKGNAFTFIIDCKTPGSNISRMKITYEYFRD